MMKRSLERLSVCWTKYVSVRRIQWPVPLGWILRILAFGVRFHAEQVTNDNHVKQDFIGRKCRLFGLGLTVTRSNY
jgi:hypothetical protein